MKPKVLITYLAALLATAVGAAPLVVTDVELPAINCVFNTNCTVVVNDTTSPIVLPNAIGTGFLQTRTVQGGSGTLAAGLFAYLYRIDLTGVTAANSEPCETNVVRCTTNLVTTTTNRLVCHTNEFPGSNRVVCVTNRIAATNIVFWFTNTVPATNFVRCTTNSAGVTFCVTNVFPGTNLICAFTNRLSASNVLHCTTISVPPTNVVTCASNRVVVTNTVVQCRTNSVPCPGTAPCIDALTLRFGLPVSLDFAGTGSNAQVFVITSGGVGTIAPTSVEQDDGRVTLHFTNGVCPGESSYFIGLVSSNRPGASGAVLELTSGSDLVVATRTPRRGGPPINCDFTPLQSALKDLEISDIIAPTDQARAGRRGSLFNSLHEARNAAEEGDLLGVLDALDKIAKKTGNNKNSWVLPLAAEGIQDALDTLLDCLEPHARQ